MDAGLSALFRLLRMVSLPLRQDVRSEDCGVHESDLGLLVLRVHLLHARFRDRDGVRVHLRNLQVLIP